MKSDATELSRIAATVQRLGVLLAAGVAPAPAWGHLREGHVTAAVSQLVANGIRIPDAIVEASLAAPTAEQAIWRALAAAWAVATDAGAPLAPTLRELSTSIRDLAQSQREIAVALASPTATARLVLVLPFIGLLFGTLLGFNTVGTLLTTPIGWVCIGLGGGLLFGAARWNRRMVRAARPNATTPGLELDLLAIAVSGGGALDRAMACVLSALDRYFTGPPGPNDAAAAVLELSRRAGVPAAALLRAEAEETRRTARADAASRAQALSVRLMIPLGVCVLPAFMLLSVVPLVVTVFASTGVRL